MSTIRCAILFLILCPLTVQAADAPAKRPMTVDDLWAVKRLGTPAISPDGNWCAVEVTTFDLAKDEPTSELWLLATDGSGRKPLTNSGGKNSGPVWSPDGKWIAFTAKRGSDDVAQVFVISSSGGEARRITRMPQAPSGVKWSPDGKTVYFIAWTWPDASTDDAHRAHEMKLKDSKSKAMIIDDAQFRYWDKWIADGKRPYVWSADVATGKHRPVTLATKRSLPPAEPTNHDFDISPDGREICFVSDNVKDIGLDANYDLFRLDISSERGQLVNLTADNPAADAFPSYSPDGKHLAFTRQTTKFFYADRSALMVMDRTSGSVRELTPNFAYSCTTPKWMPDSKRLYFEAEMKGFNRIGFVGIESPRVTGDVPAHSERSMDVAVRDRVAIYLVSSFDRAATVYAHRPGKGDAKVIEDFNAGLESKWKLGKVENRTIKGAQDRDIQMWVFYPPDFDPAKKWPLVQIVHGGPHSAVINDFSYRWNPQLWAAQGWVVAAVNFHGSSGFGKTFTDSITGDLGTMPMTDIMRATDWLCEQPWIDKSRVAAAGASYGGFMMAWLNGHTDRFKAMVCHAGVYNWHSMMASDFIKGRERTLGAPPWGDLARIDKQNPQRFAANFRTPTLVVHGEKDFRVPVTQGLEYYNTLRQKGVPTRLVYFPDENHWVLKPANSKLWHRETFDWLGKYIGHGPKG